MEGDLYISIERTINKGGLKLDYNSSNNTIWNNSIYTRTRTFPICKKAGVRIHEFAIGMGPKIYSTQKGETKYSVRLLPLGGYVSMEGEDGESNDPRAFGEKTLLQRASIIFAGPFFNIILTVLLLIPVLAYMGTPSDSNVLGKVLENTPAIEAGLQVNDKIIEINGAKIQTWDDIVNNLQKKLHSQ